MSRFVIISGPSCVGKGPLHAALKRFYPDLARPLTPVVLYNSRAPRPGEQDGVDYHFRPREEIEALRGREGVLVMDVRGDLQALDQTELARALGAGDVFFEGNPFVGGALLDCPLPDGVERLSIFVSPLSREEIEFLTSRRPRVDLAAFVTDVMRRKLLRRTKRQKTNLSRKDLENIERRAASALVEMGQAWRFDHVLANHDGEDSENWDAFYYPVGDARRTLLSVAALLAGEPAPDAETWGRDLIP
jgi:guanylate kinase